ncbi:acetate kinase, partial [Lactobacillus rhamnosus]|nr:acetate kinase [Lacticaseibacillus rhamnosus]
MSKIQAVKAGSSTQKWKLFDITAEVQLGEGLVDRMGQPQKKVKNKKCDRHKNQSQNPKSNKKKTHDTMNGK